MSEQPQTAPAQPPVNEEFFHRVNDVLQMANRIERRFDTHHAEFVLMHAFARYSAHHYRRTVKADSLEERLAFCSYIANMVAEQTAAHMDEVIGDTPAAAAPGDANDGNEGGPAA